MKWYDMLDAQTFGSIEIMTNGDSAIDMDMFNSEGSKLVRFELGRIMMNNETFSIARLIVMMTMLAVCSMQVFINDHLLSITNELEIGQ
jgi:hypothetical protein